MNRPCSSNRWYLSLSLLALLSLPQAAAAEVALREFTATYSLFEGGMHIANTELSLQHEGQFWHWRMTTNARGIFSWFTDKQPYAETVFSNDPDQLRIRQILVSEDLDKRRSESARFDWEKGTIEILRKGKTSQLELRRGVYDYQSIHLLAAQMSRDSVERKSIDFYFDGKLVKSLFLFGGNGKVNINGTRIGANIYEQTITQSDARLRYYYDSGNPILPLRIEKLEAGSSPSILTLQQVDWTL